MTDQPDSLHQDALGMLDRAGQLAARAAHMALRALPEDDDGRWVDDQALTRAAQIATIAAASARVAHGLVAVEHVELLREFEGRDETRTASENGQPDASPCPDCDYVADSAPRLGAHLALAHHRGPYAPPTLSGPHASGEGSHFRADPYDPDREHGR